MNKEQLNEEIARIQDMMGQADPRTDAYEYLVKRLNDLEELKRKLENEDTDMIKALAEQSKIEAQVEAIDMQEREGEKNRQHSKMMTVWKGIGIVGLMILGHILDESSIPRKADQRLREVFWKEKD